MSANTFINIGKINIFDRTEILSLHETSEKIEVMRKVVLVKFKNESRRPEKIILGENETLAELINTEALNA